MEQKHYTLGLDIGVASIGWAVLGNNECGDPNRIINLGVRIFDSAEVAKTGESLAAPRRDARSSRRRIRRHRHRLERIRYLLIKEGVLSQDEMAHLFESPHFDTSPYQLRAEGLDRPLTRQEFARVLIHLAQRRGYQSNSTANDTKNEKENSVIQAAIRENRMRMAQGNYRTIGEMMFRDSAFWETVNGIRFHRTRNKAGSYDFTVDRASILQEIHLLFEAQRSLSFPFASQTIEDTYTAIVASQRSFDEGPGTGSPFRTDASDRIGRCTLIPFEKRAAKADYTFEYFKLLQDLNHMRLISTNESRPLTQEQRSILEKAAFQSANLTYSQIRKKLSLAADTRFGRLFYGDKSVEEVEKRKWTQMQSYHKIRSALATVSKNAISTLSAAQLDSIGESLTLHASDARRLSDLQSAGIPPEFHAALLPLSFSGWGKLSICAMQKLIPHLQQGLRYDEACTKAGLDFRSHSGKVKKHHLSLNDADEITNPVVLRAVSQTIKVVNAVVRTYGEPDAVRVELAREMHHSFAERNKIKKRQDANFTKNEQAREQIQETKQGTRVTGLDIVKFRLFQEQNGLCLYSGQNLDISRLYEPGYADVDHIIPYSRCFDDSYSNKILVLAKENRQKGNRTPYEYFGTDEEHWHSFTVRVSSQIRDFKKRQKLLNTTFSEDRSREFIQRNLNDTQHITRVIYNLLRDNLCFADSVYSRKTERGYAPVQAVNGAITAMLRGRWGIQKVRENGDLHHCIDAVVIAATSPSMIQKLSRYYQEEEIFFSGKQFLADFSTGEALTRKEFFQRFAPKFPLPWPRFREELDARLDPIDPSNAVLNLHLSTYEPDENIRPVFVSHMPNRTVTGAAHEETIRGTDQNYPGCTVAKVSLSKLKLNSDQEIDGYYSPQTDPRLYHALVERLKQFGGDGKRAFAEPFFKPKRDGTPGPRVDKVKIVQKSTLNVSTGRGSAANGKMVRIDVFHIPDDGYYFVPIYVADTRKDKLPCKAVVAHKPISLWKPMRDADFLFSIFRDDLIRIESRKSITLTLAKNASGERKIDVKSGFFYFRGADISSGSIALETHDRRYSQDGLGIKTLAAIEKYQVDVLGNISRVKIPEKRLDFQQRK